MSYLLIRQKKIMIVCIDKFKNKLLRPDQLKLYMTGSDTKEDSRRTKSEAVFRNLNLNIESYTQLMVSDLKSGF